MFRAADRWLAGYLRSVRRRPGRVAGPRHLLFCVCDHYEPFGPGAPDQPALEKVKRWGIEYPVTIRGFHDADGRSPQHSFFYPAEEYDADCLNALAGLCAHGYGEIEVHLHHRNDTAASLAERLVTFRDQLRHQHGCLGQDADGALRYGFIHGNWALCNSRPDGDWCGVNEELGVLNETGCYADFTFPSAPSPTQPRIVNTLYYAWDGPGGEPDGCASGVPARVGTRAEARGERQPLLMVTGPLAPNWAVRKWGVLPRLENGDVTGANPPTQQRIDLWVRQGIHVLGRPEWIFVKVYTHGCVTANANTLLGDAMIQAHAYLADAYNDGEQWQLHYVTARELVNIAHAAEAGEAGNPDRYRDYVVQPPPCRAAERP